MKRNDLYVLRKIANIPYLLPTGQLIADQRRGVQLNDTGIFLWHLLKEERTMNELVTLCAQHYEMEPEDISVLQKDIEEFISILTERGIILYHRSDSSITSDYYNSMEIAGLKCRLYGPKDAFSNHFDAFFCDDTDAPEQTIKIVTHIPPIHENGTMILRNSELSILECTDEYIILFPTLEHIQEVHLSKDASFARFFCTGPYTDEFREHLFHAIRLVFLYLAQKHNMVVLHSSSILYRQKSWLFSASSGTGKSTHADLWKKLAGAPILNGDLNLLALENGKPVIHGIPWCGTSGIYNTHTYPLGGIILLKRAPSNYTQTLSEDQKRLLITQRLISPSWNSAQLDVNLNFVDELTRHIFICRLFCTPDASAMEILKKEIDSLYF